MKSQLLERYKKKDSLQSFIFQTSMVEKTKAKQRMLDQSSKTNRYLRRFKRALN